MTDLSLGCLEKGQLSCFTTQNRIYLGGGGMNAVYQLQRYETLFEQKELTVF